MEKRKRFIPVVTAGFFIFFFSFLQGAFFPAAVFAARKTYNRNISVEGVEIGGMARQPAEILIRGKIISELKKRTLKIYCGNGIYSFCYPEINYLSNLSDLLKRLLNENPAEKTDYGANIKYYLNNMDGVIERICMGGYKAAENASIYFDAESDNPFVITEGRTGSEINKKALRSDIMNSLSGGFYDVHTENSALYPEITKDELEEYTYLRSKFSTGYEWSPDERKHNITLASSFISGCVLENGEEFSFNKTVGERSEKRGFKQAKIIFDGRFTEGFGGGVCQLSTTLYNAALTAGLEITEQHRHTLAVSYVEPSFDAMVNSYTSDLKFRNTTGGKVFIKIKADGKRVTAYIYGAKNNYVYKRISVIKKQTPPPPPEIVFGDTEEIVQYAKWGIESEGYIEIYEKGALVSKKLIRTDKYKPCPEIKKIIQN